MHVLRIGAHWHYEIKHDQIIFLSYQSRKRISIRLNGIIAERAENLIKNIYLGFDQDSDLITQIEETFGIDKTNAESFVALLIEKKILFRRQKIKTTDVKDQLFDRTIRFLNTFETDSITGEERHKMLRNTSVFIVGLGSYGCVVADSLVRMGIGKLIAIDYDKVELSNLDRQVLYTQNDIGKYKSDCAQKALSSIHSQSQVICINHEVKNEDDITPLIRQSDIIVNTFGYLSDGFSKSNIPEIIVNAAYNEKKKCISFGGSIYGPFNDGQSAPCYFCFKNMFGAIGGLIDPDKRSPLVQRRMLNPITATLCNLVVLEIMNEACGITSGHLKDRVASLNWQDEGFRSFYKFSTKYLCERCKND